jgi:hypothetical protein
MIEGRIEGLWSEDGTVQMGTGWLGEASVADHMGPEFKANAEASAEAERKQIEADEVARRGEEAQRRFMAAQRYGDGRSHEEILAAYQTASVQADRVQAAREAREEREHGVIRPEAAQPRPNSFTTLMVQEKAEHEATKKVPATGADLRRIGHALDVIKQKLKRIDKHEAEIGYLFEKRS